MNEGMIVGQGIPRVDAPGKITGCAEYTGDLAMANLLEADFLGSPYAYARIRSVDTSKAERLEGVVAVITGKDVEGLYGTTVLDRPILAKDVVRFAGEPVAAVAATSKEIAREAVKLIEVEYEELAGVFDPEEAASPDAPILHENLESYVKEVTANAIPGTNICNHFKIRKGDVEKGFAEADRVFEDTYVVPRNHHTCLETHAVTAKFEKEGLLRVWTGNQSPYVLQRGLAKLFNIPWNMVRVTIPALGGGFGSKIYPSIEPLCVALAKKTGNRPVRLYLTREQDFISSVTNHGCRIKIKTGVKKDGTIVSRQLTTYWDTGAYADCGPLVARNSGFTSAGPYRIPNVKIDAYAVYTNRPVASAFRGYGIPHVTWAYESQIDEIAFALGMDPLELRIKNVLVDGDISHTGEKMVAVGIKECLEKLGKAIGWEPGKRPPVEDLGNGVYKSLGLACSWKGSMRHYSSGATVRIMEDSSVLVNNSNIDMGQGSATIFTQIAAQELGASLSQVKVLRADTFMTPYDRTTSASRGTFHAGTAVMNAAKDAFKMLRELAAKAFDCEEQRIKAKDGLIEDPKTGKKYTFGQVINKAVPGGVEVIGRGYSMMEGGTGLDRETGQGANPTSFWMYTAQAAEIELDTNTGKIKVNRIVAVNDVGKAINEVNVRQQIEGAVAMGVGIALMEELKFNDGVVVNSNLHDYKIPTAADMPDIETIIVEVPHPLGPYGAKGLGEAPVAPMPPAIANAVRNVTGVRIYKTPLSPENVLKELRKDEVK